MGKIVGIVVALVLVVTGAVWTGQGLGWIEGSRMSNVDIWAIIGPLVAGLGVAMLITVLRPKDLDQR